MDREGGPGSQKRPRSKKAQPSNHVLSSDEETSPTRGYTSKSKMKMKKPPRSNSPSMIEDIIDGFAIQSFRTQDDLEVTIFLFNLDAIFQPVVTSLTKPDFHHVLAPNLTAGHNQAESSVWTLVTPLRSV